MSAQEDIKILLLKNGMTITKLAEEMTISSGKKISRNVLSQKLKNGTLRYTELETICKVLGYTLEYKKQNNF